MYTHDKTQSEDSVLFWTYTKHIQPNPRTNSPSKVAIISTANSIQSYRSLDYARQLYAGSSSSGSASTSPATPLSARTFGTWTFLSAVVRAYAAYHITQPVAYDLALWTYGIALAHFVSEWLVFGTAQLRGRFVAPLVVASSTLAWMVTQRGWYLE